MATNAPVYGLELSSEKIENVALPGGKTIRNFSSMSANGFRETRQQSKKIIVMRFLKNRKFLFFVFLQLLLPCKRINLSSSFAAASAGGLAGCG